MDIGNIFGKIQSNADKIGGILGAYSTLAQEGGENAMQGANLLLKGLIQTPHFPNFEHVANHLMNWNRTFMPGLQAMIIGWLMKEIDIDPMVGRFGNVIMKAGMGAAIASAVTDTLYFSGLYHSPGSGSNGGGNSGLKSLWGA